MMHIFGTGHRPEDLNCSIKELKAAITTELTQYHVPIDVVITGMAAGFDLALGEAALDFGIDVWAAVPWVSHSPRAADVEIYDRIMAEAKEVVIVNSSMSYPGPWVYHERNEWMVDHADEGLCYWTGKKSGGTYACLTYARRQKKPVTNVKDGMNQ